MIGHWLLAIAALFSVQTAHAATQNLDNIIFVPSGSEVIRINNNNQTQIRYNPNLGEITQIEKLGDELLIIAGSKVYESSDGFVFSKIIQFNTVPKIKIFDDYIVALSGDELFVIGKDGKYQQFVYDNGDFSEYGGDLYWIMNSAVSAEIYKLTGGDWQESATVGCNYKDYSISMKAILCTNGDLYINSTLVKNGVTNIKSSDDILVGIAADKTIIYPKNSASLTTCDVAASNIHISKNRVFVDYKELSWQGASCQILAPPTNIIVINDIGAGVLLTSATTSYYSPNIGEFLPTNFVGAVDYVYGAIIQSGNNIYTTIDFLNYSKNSVAKKISKIINENGYFSLYTDDYYFYRFSDLSNFGKSTSLKSTKLYSLQTIGDIRNLPAGAYVIAIGTISTKKDLSMKNTIYIEDMTGGVQLYSSSLSDYDLGDKVIVVGSVSSSTTKRILPTEILPIGSSSLINRNFDENYQNNLGVVGWIVGTVNDVNTDDFNLKIAEDIIKIHFADAKDIFAIGDSVSLKILLDWNYSSKAIEGWFDGEYDILSHATVVANEQIATPTTSKTIKTISAVKTGDSTVIDSQPATNLTVAKNTIPITKPTAIVQGTNKPPNNNLDIFSAFIGIIGGAVVAFGGRLKLLAF